MESSISESRNERRMAVAAVAVIVAASAFSFGGGLAPRSLWVDDLWPAVLVDEASLSELFSIRAPVSPFFILLVRAVTVIAGAGDIAYQIVPFGAALAAIPLVAVAVFRATHSSSAASVAAALTALNATLATYAVRVKSYSLDAALIALLLVIALRERNRTSAIALMAAGALAAPLSFTSIFLSVPLAISSVVRWREPRVVGAFLAFSGVVASTFFLVMAPRSTAELREFWRGYYLPPALPELFSFASGELLTLFVGAFPPYASLAVLFVPFGFFAMWRRERDVAIASAAMFVLLLVASATSRYPIGTGRTDAFTYPVTLLFASAGLVSLAGRWIKGLAVAAVLVSVLMLGTKRTSYVDTYDRDVIRLANQHVPPGDLMLVYPYSSWALAHYGKWPVRLERTRQTTNGFYAIPIRPNTLVLGEKPNHVDFREDPHVLAEQLAPLFAADPQRVWLVATSAEPVSNRWIVDNFRVHGYGVAAARGFKGAGFALFARGR